MLIYRYDPSSLNSIGKLFVSKKEGTSWSKAKELKGLGLGDWNPSASMTEDQQTLFIASNKSGGQGGTDLYISHKQENGAWGPAENMGEAINTSYDEDSPLIHPDGKTLYFSSKGHSTTGGYDIFSATYDADTKTWGNVKNVGYPINSAHDDIHFYWSADGTRVYFSGKRPRGKGEKDLYYFKLQQEENHILELKGAVVDAETGSPLKAQIQVVEHGTQDVVHTYETNSASGKYILFFSEFQEYTITVEALGYKRYTEDLKTKGLDVFKELNKNIQLKKNTGE